MYKIWILWITFLLVGSCLKPKLDELEFFEVSMDQPVAVAVGELNLTGRCTTSKIDACGFYYAKDVTQLLRVADTDSIQSPLPQNGTSVFIARFTGLLQEQTLYFRAFMRQGKRTVYSEVYSFGLGQLISINGTTSRQNDTLITSGQISGIKTQHLEADGHGHVYSSVNKLPAVGSLGCDSNDLGAVNDDLIFTSRIPGMQFNTRYYIRSYLRVGAKFYYSKMVDSFLIEDGWKQVVAGPFTYYGGSGLGVEAEGKAFVGFGCNSNNCTQDALPENFVSYSPSADTGSWENETPFNGTLKCTNAAMFQIGDTIYVFGGEAQVSGIGLITAGGYWKKYAINSGLWRVENDPLPPRRSRAVAFRVGNKGYIGAGHKFIQQGPNTISVQLNDFWEYDPATGSWRKVASLPQKIGANDLSYVAGRKDAVVFSNGITAYVGGGLVGATFLQDFWQFTPPNNSVQDTGKWEFTNFFPGVGRDEAAYFSINSRGYYGLGKNGISGTLSDFWEFSFSDQKWHSTEGFPGGRRRSVISFSLLNKGYVFGGIRNKVLNNGNVTDDPQGDCWRYEPKNQ